VNHASLGELLKDARRAAGLTQDALAARAGLSTRAISDLERNVNHAPRPTTVRLLVAALGLSEREREHFEAVARADASSPLAIASSVPPLIGRAKERVLLEQHVGGEGPPVLLLAGEPGIGKTRLLQEAATLAATRGLTVLLGTVPARGESNPLDPIADAVRHEIQRRSPVLVRRDLQGCGWLVRMLPELADGPLGPALAGAASLEQEPALIADAVVRFIANTADAAGTLLVLEDLHRADGSALALLSRIVRSTRHMRLRIIAAYRDGHVAGEEQLSALLGMFAHEHLARHVAIPALSTREAAELLRAIAGDRSQVRESWRARALHDSGGVPFYIVAWAHSIGAVQLSATDQLPWTIQQSIRDRIISGPPAVRPVLEALAVAGGRATFALLVRLAGQRAQEVLAALEWAARERLVDEDGEAYAFAYEVIRAAVEADLTHTRRVLVRRRLTALIGRDIKGLEARPPATPTNEREYHLSVLMQATKSAAKRRP
jgi:predicted ATPase/DNA-binding XRE family transcriptional regulator